MVKKIVFFVVMAAIVAAFGGCQKEGPISQLADEQPQVVVKPDVYAENGYLVFKDYATYDSIAEVLNSNSMEFIAEFENKMGFKSAFTYRNEVMKKSDGLSDLEIIPYLNELSKKGYFDLQSQEFTFPFYNESRSFVLSPNGKVKIGEVFYQFEGTYETVTPDLSGKKYNGVPGQLSKKINLHELGSQLKSATILFDNTTAGGQQRLTMRIYRENEAIYGIIYVPGVGNVVGILGYHWYVKLRFHSWRQRRYSKSDKNTYFHWIANHYLIGGNNGLRGRNYSNPNTQTSSYKAIYYEGIYDSNITPITTAPTIYNIDADCWSDRLSNPKNYIDYP